SHELRTPLNAILGWSKILRTKKLDDAAFAQATEAIERGARSQSKIIEDILDLSRIISGKLRLEVQKVDLLKVIEMAVDIVSLAAQAKNIRLEIILDSNGVVSGDSHRLQQVVWNLLTNAIKFTPKGGRVQVRLERVNSSVEISVSDTGKGISPEFLPYVFDRFQQADNTSTGRQGGLGLGLSITRHIVELHGGTIRAESSGENMGATFTVSLPVMIVHRKDDSASSISENQSSAEEENSPLSTQLNGLRTLVVDDEADSRDLLTAILTLHGAQVTAASNVAEAVEKFQTVKPDLIISDIGMPGEDGFSLIKKLKAFNKDQKQKIPAIALTAYASQSDRLKILSAGYQMHLAKPIEPEELLIVIANLANWNGK
ncbi:MAG TPA: ATP-binding protein, partial [Pyrinomonadaceae bacterium]|nr:ATP-binding protein [Pyrinomonadaceae bacterium]